MNLIHLEIITPQGKMYNDDIYQLEVKTSSGYMGILHGHIPVIASIEPSMIYIKDAKMIRHSAIVNSGILKTDKDHIKIITDMFFYEKNQSELLLNQREQMLKNKSQLNEKMILKIEREVSQIKELLAKK